MVESFITLKKEEVKRCWIFCAVTAVSVAVLLFGALFTACKVLERSLPWYIYLAVSFGSLLLVGGIALLFCYPTTKRFAKTLDTTYRLGEKVQTMVEFTGKEGAVIELQRAQTDRALSALPPRKKTFFSVLKMVAMPVLAVAMLVTAIVLPNTAPPKVAEGENPYESGVYQVRNLETLIANVQKSTLTDDLKTPYVATLTDLLTLIKDETTTHNQMMAGVRGSMNLIITLTRADNTYNAYVSAICAAEQKAAILPLAKALSDSGEAYREVTGINVRRFSTVDSAENKQELLTKVKEILNTYASEVNAELSAIVEEDAYRSYITDYTTQLTTVLGQIPTPTEESVEPILGALLRLNEKLLATNTQLGEGGYTLEGVCGEAATAFTDFIEGSGNAGLLMNEQAYSYLMKDYVLRTLGDIFGVSVPTEDSSYVDENSGSGGLPGGSEGNEGGSGGGGSGELEFPNDGLVLDPSDGTYKPYGELIGKYYSNVLQLLETEEISEELRTYLEAYFNALQSKE